MIIVNAKDFGLIPNAEELQHRAIQKAIDANRYQVDNKNVPKYKINEYDLPLVEEIYEEIEFIMAALGYRMNDANDQSNQKIFTTSRRGIIGMGTYSGEAFDLLPGSEIDMTKPSLTQSYNAKRQEYLGNGTIAKKDDGKFYLTKVLTFKTPSGASDFVLGGSTNGWTEWKDRDGKTLNDLFRSNQ